MANLKCQILGNPLFMAAIGGSVAGYLAYRYSKSSTASVVASSVAGAIFTGWASFGLGFSGRFGNCQTEQEKKCNRLRNPIAGPKMTPQQVAACRAAGGRATYDTLNRMYDCLCESSTMVNPPIRVL